MTVTPHKPLASANPNAARGMLGVSGPAWLRSPFREISMNHPNYLFVGGLVAMGFDATGKYLLTVTHSGRGVFAVGTWERVARDATLTYLDAGKAIGIGPIDGQTIEVQERDERRDRIAMNSPDGRFQLLGDSEGIAITESGAALVTVPPHRSASHT